MGSGTVPLGELGRFVEEKRDDIIFHKDLRPVEYVVGDAVGRLGAPVYPMLEMEDRLATYTTPDGVVMAGNWMGAPPDDGRSSFEWGGEWTVTFETFRDMGMAFGVALVLIYILVVWEFGNFVVPAVIMAPIPLTLLGIVPGHWLLDAEFTATSMIGFIALAGIIVRNSILLVDFSIEQVEHGMALRDAVLQACKARTRPIVITALALVAGSSVILTDPIFQGMAVSLLFGVMVSTVLTLVVIPLGCISAGKHMRRPG
jgi:multidrug efflux pump subunit AcrB